MSPMASRRWRAFRAHRRGYWSSVIFALLFAASLGAEFVANDRPLLVRFEGRLFVPVLSGVSEDAFGPDFLPTEADFTDPELQRAIRAHGWMVWPLIPYSYDTVVKNLPVAPSPPSWAHPLGTDDQSRDVLARVIYGFRVSVLFGFALTILSSAVGIAVGAVQGYRGGWVDLLGQRVVEVWSGMPVLFLLIVLGSIVVPGFWVLLGFLLLFSWMGLTGVVRAEFLRGRQLDYVRAARALGVSDTAIMLRHILPNALVAVVSVPAVHAVGLGDGAGQPGLPGLRAAAGLALAGRAGGAGQEQPAGALAGSDRVRGAGRAAHPADLRWRGGTGRARSTAGRMSVSGLLWGRQASKSLLFLKKKKQKDFCTFCTERTPRSAPNGQTFFGSFFQKRTRLLASFLHRST